MANNRKGKLIFFYEWVIKADWVADLDDPDAEETKGTLEIPNLSEENEAHEVDVRKACLLQSMLEYFYLHLIGILGKYLYYLVYLDR